MSRFEVSPGATRQTLSILVLPFEKQALRSASATADMPMSAWMALRIKEASSSPSHVEAVAASAPKLASGPSRTVRVSVMLFADEVAALDRVAKRHALTRHAFMQAAVLQALTTAPKALPQMAGEGLPAPLLTRLERLQRAAMADLMPHERQPFQAKIMEAGAAASVNASRERLRKAIDLLPREQACSLSFVSGWLSLAPETVLAALLRTGQRDAGA